jgi:drug/metabolite transporter (DMT)-like permease
VATVALLAVAGEAIPPGPALAWAAVAGSAGVIGLGTFYVALARGTMGLVAPLTALIGAAIPALVGIATGEPVGILLVVGIVAALAAVVVISVPDAAPLVSEPAETAGTRPAPARSRVAELALMGIAGLGFAGFYLGIDQAHDTGGETWWPLVMVRATGLLLVVGTTIAVALSGRAPLVRVPVALLPVLVLAGLGDLGGNLFFILANEGGDLAVAVVLSSLYPVVTAILARLFLAERLSRTRQGGVALALVGVVLIALGRT